MGRETRQVQLNVNYKVLIGIVAILLLSTSCGGEYEPNRPPEPEWVLTFSDVDVAGDYRGFNYEFRKRCEGMVMTGNHRLHSTGVTGMKVYLWIDSKVQEGETIALGVGFDSDIVLDIRTRALCTPGAKDCFLNSGGGEVTIRSMYNGRPSSVSLTDIPVEDGAGSTVVVNGTARCVW